MDRHLVTIKVGVECGADQRVKLNCLTFNQNRLKCLNAKTVKRRCAVQHDRVFADNLFKNIPDFRTLFFDHTLCSLDRRCHAVEFQLGIDEWLEQFERHLLRQSALMQLQFRTHNDDRTAGIIDALAEQVLTETTLLALQHVRHRLQRTLVRTGNGTTTTTVIKQGIN